MHGKLQQYWLRVADTALNPTFFFANSCEDRNYKKNLENIFDILTQCVCVAQLKPALFSIDCKDKYYIKF